MKEKTKVTIGMIGVILLILLTIGSVLYIILHKSEKISNETNKVTNINTGEVVTDSNVNLNDYSSNITINKSGEYILTGTLKYSLIIDTTSDITLNLNNANLNSSTSSAIIVKNSNGLKINLVSGSENTLSDGGSSSYNATIYADSKLTIDGTGKLTINSNQVNGSGINTLDNFLTIDNGIIIVNSVYNGLLSTNNITLNNGRVYIDAKNSGISSTKNINLNNGVFFIIGQDKGSVNGTYYLNGGTFIGLANTLVMPNEGSNQKTIGFNSKNKIAANTIVSLEDYNDNEILTIKTPKEFSSLIISSNKIYKGTYHLYQNGTDEGTLSYGLYQNYKYKKGTLIGTFKLANQVESFEG